MTLIISNYICSCVFIFAIAGPSEYCNMENFNATCDRNHVILIRTARYGRMKIGRCVKGNYGYLGCAADVRTYMETKCSGRHTCKLEVPDGYLHKSKPCPGDFTSYLEVAYECLRGRYKGFISTAMPVDRQVGEVQERSFYLCTSQSISISSSTRKSIKKIEEK